MSERKLTVSRQFELHPPVAQPPQPATNGHSSDFDVIINEFKNPTRFAAAGLGIGFFIVLVGLPIVLILIPLAAFFMKLLGI